MASDFYLRYYVGHKGKFGHEFLEFEFRPDGEERGGTGTGRGARRGLRSGRGPRPGRPLRCRGLMSALSSAGKLRYANNSNYKNDVMIRKEVRSAAAGSRGSLRRRPVPSRGRVRCGESAAQSTAAAVGGSEPRRAAGAERLGLCCPIGVSFAGVCA